MAAEARSIKSVERTLALFELFSREQQPFTVGRISAALNIPQPSVSMLLRNLTELGYLEHNLVCRTYSPSIRVALLGSWVNRRLGEGGKLAERLNTLHRQVGETTYLAIQNGAAMQYVMSQRPEHPDRLEVDSGHYRSLTFSAPGRALLSQKRDKDIPGWVRRCNAEATEDRFKVREGDFMKLIAQVRAQGFASTEGDVTPGLGAFAFTFNSPMGTTRLAVGVGGPIPRIREKRALILESLVRFKRSFGN